MLMHAFLLACSSLLHTRVISVSQVKKILQLLRLLQINNGVFIRVSMSALRSWGIDRTGAAG